MAGSFLKEGYQDILADPQWAHEAERFEFSMARYLHNNAEVKETARRAMLRISDVLVGYFTQHTDPSTLSGGPPPAIEQAAEVLPGIEEIVGGSSAPSESESDSAPPETESTLEAPNAIGADAPAELRAQILTRAFLKNDGGSAGQVGFTGDQRTDVENLSGIMGSDGNLRERMTALFNVMVLNSGRKASETSRSISLKRIGLDVSREEARALNMDYSAIRKDRGLVPGDILDVKRIQRHRSTFSRNWGLRKGSQTRSNRKKSEQLEHTLDAAHQRSTGTTSSFYDDNGMSLSPREAAFQQSEKGGTIKEGLSFFRMRNTKWSKQHRNRGFRLIAGPSGTTSRMLMSYRWVGASQEELLKFRLALIGWMVAGDHSLYEILKGSKAAGVVGKEDTTNAITMYQTVDPLTFDQLRDNIAPDYMFPHEHILMNRLETGGLGENKDVDKALKHGSKAALYLYTADFYRIMNAGLNKDNQAAQAAMLWNLESISDDHKLWNKAKKEAVAKRSADTLRMATAVAIQSIQHLPKVKGKKVFRAARINKFNRNFTKPGGRVTCNTITSTSLSPDVAWKFHKDNRDRRSKFWQKDVIMEIDLSGFSGVRVASISKYSHEEEITLLPGAVLEVSGKPRTEDGTMVIPIREVGNTSIPKGQTAEDFVEGDSEEDTETSQPAFPRFSDSTPALGASMGNIEQLDSILDEGPTPTEPELSQLEDSQTDLDVPTISHKNISYQFLDDSEINTTPPTQAQLDAIENKILWPCFNMSFCMKIEDVNMDWEPYDGDQGPAFCREMSRLIFEHAPPELLAVMLSGKLMSFASQLVTDVWNKCRAKLAQRLSVPAGTAGDLELTASQE